MKEGELISSSSSNPISNHEECSKKTLLLFQTVSKQLEGLDSKIDNIRTDLMNGTINYVELKANHDSLCREVEENLKPRITKLEKAREDDEKEEKNDIKMTVGWIIAIASISLTIIIEAIRYLSR